MIKQIGYIQINKRFLRFLNFDTKKLLKKVLWSKIKILTVDFDAHDIFTICAESKELFYKIRVGSMKIPNYNIVLHTNPDGTLKDITIELDKKEKLNN